MSGVGLMRYFEFSDSMVHNVLVFLSRVQYAGTDHFAEVEAIQQIRAALHKPYVKTEEGMLELAKL